MSTEAPSDVRSAVLLYNPAAGSSPRMRAETITAVAQALRARGLKVEIMATDAPGSAGGQAASLGSGTDIVFACGGDGTLHEVLQGLADPGQAAARPALGVIPLGSANALARDLRLPLDPVAAALLQLAWQPRTIPLGRIEWTAGGEPQARYFAVMAGAGPHGTLVYDLLAPGPGGKQSLGRLAYYVRSAHLFLTRSLPLTSAGFGPFRVDVTDAAGSTRTVLAVSAIAVRVASLGGIFHPLATGGSLESPTLRLILVRPPAPVALPLWFGLSWLGLARWNPLVESRDVTGFTCHAGSGVGAAPDLQADGEWLGKAPAVVAIVPNALRMLMPSR